MNQNNPLDSTSPAGEYNPNAWRERFIVPVLRTASVLGVGMFAIAFSITPVSSRIFVSILLIALFAITFLPVSYNLRAYALLFLCFMLGLNGVLLFGVWVDATVFFLCFIALSSLLFDNNFNISALIFNIVILIGLASLFSLGVLSPTDPHTPQSSLARWALFILDFAVCGIIVVIAANSLKREFARAAQQAQNSYQALSTERAQLEDTVRDRTNALKNRSVQLQSSTNIARTLAEIQNVPDLLKLAVDAVTEEFNYYHAGVYLLNAQKQVAFLQAASSQIGADLIGAGHRIGAGVRNPINIVLETRRPYATTDLDKARFIPDVNFPTTRSRVVIPLIVRGEIIGALDLQSNKLESTNEEDIDIFETVADLLAISIDNVRLIGETQTLVEQLRFYNSDQAQEAWAKITSRRSPAYQYTPAGVRPVFGQSKKDESPIGLLQIPLTLQGQKIGNIHLRRKGYTTNWSDKERTLVEKIAEQISLALENSRLVEEAQQNAQRDQLIANISSRVRETLDVEAVIRTATTELRRVFDLKEAEISVGLPQAEPKPTRKHTSALKLR